MTNSDVVIRVESLGKKYTLHHEQSERTTALRDVVARQPGGVLGAEAHLTCLAAIHQPRMGVRSAPPWTLPA